MGGCLSARLEGPRTDSAFPDVFLGPALVIFTNPILECEISQKHPWRGAKFNAVLFPSSWGTVQ